MTAPPGPEVQLAVRALLATNPAFAKLTPKLRTQISRDTTLIVDYLVQVRVGTGAFLELIEEVTFPAFVADLINSVFQAIVNASIQQMKAYAELVAAVAKSLEKFRDENITDSQARDHLARSSKILDDDDWARAKTPRVKRKLASSRQQLLATMLLMGINRIVVTEGKISAKKSTSRVRSR